VSRYTVQAPYQVHHDGVTYGPGETLDLSDEIGTQWAQAGYVTTATTAKPPAKARKSR
jgi:hypothetical protein